MAEFMARVELFRADGEEYKDLHEKMEAIGLKRTVIFDDGKKYAMPIGTYFGSSSLSAASLRERILGFATPLSSPGGPSIFVCQSQEWSARLFTD